MILLIFISSETICVCVFFWAFWHCKWHSSNEPSFNCSCFVSQQSLSTFQRILSWIWCLFRFLFYLICHRCLRFGKDMGNFRKRIIKIDFILNVFTRVVWFLLHQIRDNIKKYVNLVFIFISSSVGYLFHICVCVFISMGKKMFLSIKLFATFFVYFWLIFVSFKIRLIVQTTH